MIGQVIADRYRVEAKIARGGMSTVFQAEDLRLSRDVALKLLHPHLADDPAVVARFEAEARTAAALTHPNVVNVYDQGSTTAGGQTLAYLVMELVPGLTLRDVITRQAPLDPALAIQYLLPIAQGLQVAHRAGVVHRDMKPENVLVSPTGQVKVTDFGLARAATQHTGTGATLMGTVAYISPELVSGDKADQRTDIYAVGIIAFELLTGRQPFTGDTPVQVALQHANSRVPAPSTYVSSLPESVDDFVVHCTEPDPDQRPSNAQQLVQMLETIQTQFSGHSGLPSFENQTQVLGFQQHQSHSDPFDETVDAQTSGETDIAPEFLPRVSVLAPEEPAQPEHESRQPLSVERAVETSSGGKPQPSPVKRKRPNSPTYRLLPARPIKHLLVLIAVLMLAAAAVLAGWWIGSSAFSAALTDDRPPANLRAEGG